MVNKKNILITGSNGQLGACLNQISSSYNFNFFFKNKDKLDITNYIKFENFIKNNKIDIIINCAAYTDVEKAEVEQKLAEKINSKAVNNLANICSKLSLQLIHISTDYVFDGNKNLPYTEYDRTNPLNTYGITKLVGENNILNYNLKKSVIIRTSWIYSSKKRNFVNKILEKILIGKPFKVVCDEFGSPTNAEDLADAILSIIPKINNDKTEIYHFSNLGVCSRFELALKIKELVFSDVEIIPTQILNPNIYRPKYSKLNSDKFMNTFDFRIKNWEESLEKYLCTSNE